MKKWIRLLLLLLVVGLALAGAFAWFALGTERGARFTFARLVALTEGRLSVGEVRGTLPAPLTLTNVRYADPAAGMDVRIERLVIDVGATAALSRRALIESLEAQGVAVTLTSVPTDPRNRSPWQPPLDFVVERARVTNLSIVKDGEPLPRFDRVELAGQWTADGIVVERLDASGPDMRLDLEGRFASARGHRGQAKGSFAWKVDGVPWAGVLDATSDGRNARANLALETPMAAAAVVTAIPGDDAMPWTATFDAPAFDPAVLSAEGCRGDADCEPSSLREVSAKLAARGDRERFALSGDVTLNDHAVRVERFEGRLDDRALSLDALRLSSPEAAGTLDAKGVVRLDVQPATARLDLAWQDVVIPEDLAGQSLATHGTAAFEGSAEAYAAQGRFALGPPGRIADIEASIEGGGDRIAIRTLKLLQPEGALTATGTVVLEPALGWEIDAQAERFDPGAFLASWPGRLDFALATTGRRTGDELDATLKLERLAGELRGRPVAGEADLRVLPGGRIEGSATLRSGASTVALTGSGGERNDVRAKLDVASLGDFVPDSAGRIEGEVHATGAWPALDVAADLRVQDLFWRGTRVRAGTVKAEVQNLEAPSGELSIAAQDLEAGARRFDAVTLTASGSEASHRLVLDADGAEARVAATLEGGRNEAGYAGTLSRLELAVPDAAAVALEAPARVASTDGAWSVSESCLAVTAPGDADAGRICLASEAAADGALDARYRVERVPLGLVVALAQPGAPLRSEGVLDGSGRVARDAAGAWRGSATLASPEGLVAYPDTAEDPLLRYTGLAFDAELAPESSRATLRAALDEGGSLDGALASSGGNLDGRIDLELKSLRFVELLSPAVANPKGTIAAHYTIGGSTDAPRLAGALELAGFSAELPEQGLVLSDGRATLRAEGHDRYALEGSLKSGEGTLEFRGTGGTAVGAAAEIAVRGERVLAMDLPGVKILASPDLTLTRDGQSTKLRGKIELPEASVNLARLPGGGAAKASKDVVVVDEAATTEAQAASPLDTNITVVLGERVKVRGYGLDGEVEGRLKVRERPGRPTTGTGQIRIAGKYRAYGQNLTIERGRLLFAQSPLDDPGLDIRAVRKLRTVTPGLRVAGTVKAPVLTVFSDPPMEQGNALSYLVTGRPLRSLSGEDGDTVGMAARALGTATGDLLAKSIGAKLGVDEIGVGESDALGGAAFTVGKYLSPRLYLSYGVGVFEPGQVVTLRYQLTEHWELEANSGTVENRGGVNYRYERD